MKMLSLFGATVAATLALSGVASAEYVSRIACVPNANVSEGPYWVDCQSSDGTETPSADCSCKEGFTAFNPSVEDTTGSGERPQPISASPG